MLVMFRLAPYVCGTVRDDCHPYRASCTDTGNGNYDCECVKNYVGDGKSCEGMDGEDRWLKSITLDVFSQWLQELIHDRLCF